MSQMNALNAADLKAWKAHAKRNGISPQNGRPVSGCPRSRTTSAPVTAAPELAATTLPKPPKA